MVHALTSSCRSLYALQSKKWESFHGFNWHAFMMQHTMEINTSYKGPLFSLSNVSKTKLFKARGENGALWSRG
jgi:hypothetical protein